MNKLPGLEARSSESDPREYSTKLDLLNSDKSLRVIAYAYIPLVDGEYQPVNFTSDAGFKQGYDSAITHFADKGDTFDETKHSTTNLKW